MYGKNKILNAPSDSHAKDKLNLYVYEYLYHIGAAKAAQGFCADMKWEPSKMSLGEPPGFLLSWWCVFWDLYSAAPERREQHPHSEEAKAFHDYGFINTNGGMPPQPNPNGPPGMPMNVNEGMHTPGVPIFPPPGSQMISPYPRYPNAPPRSLIRMPPQPDYPVGPGMPPQMDVNRNGLRMTPPGARMPTNPIGHPGPMANAYRPQGISPSINPPGPRPYMTNSPGMGYSSSSPAPYGPAGGHTPTTPTMMSSPQDTNGGEMQPYSMRNIPPGMAPGPTPMFHDQHLTHLPPDMSHHTPMNGEYDQQMKQSPNQQSNPTLPPPPAPPDVTNYSNFDESNTDTNAILKLKESMQEEVKKFDKTPNTDDFNHFGSVG